MAFNIANLLVLLGIIYGVSIRRDLARHVRVMKFCFFLDVSLLIAVELGRGAVEKALGIEPKPDEINLTMLWIHIPFAILSLVFWIVQLVVGRRIIRGQRHLLSAHFRNAVIFLAMRIGNFATALLLYA